jgi:hypothetical protein
MCAALEVGCFEFLSTKTKTRIFLSDIMPNQASNNPTKNLLIIGYLHLHT